MTFTSAMQSLRSGEATKRESWVGYVYKMEAPDSTSDCPKYDVVIVQKDGTKFTYPFGTTTEAATCELTKSLMAGFLSDDWIRGSAEEFEKARTGGGGDF